ncbi:ABC transporter permease subunit [Sinorhizobium meliloti]|uniref:ABC transporter permease n=1 Tax=Rhizobium meliloti TaxID=382 RepID=UPI001297239E|nr:ABC transporter permease [Sinorhizobium meliloti]MQX38697.1 ABC transporter permease subunit [Sinorhizobium meliloti]
MKNKAGLLALPALPLVALFCVSVIWVVFVSLSSANPRFLYGLPATATNYLSIFSSPFAYRSVVRSIYLGVVSTAICIALGFLIASHISRNERRKDLIVSIILSVYMVSFIVKIFALSIILAPAGPLNELLLASGLASNPVIFMGTELAVVIGLVYTALPITILVLLSQFEQIPHYYNDAAACFGANRWQRLRYVHLPLAMPGIMTCIVFTLPPSIAAFEVPMLLGRGRVNMISTQIYQSSSGVSGASWPLAASLSILLLFISGGIILAIQYWMARRNVV